MLSCTGFPSRSRVRGIIASAAALAAISLSTAEAEELNALVWCDHADPALLKPFEAEHGVRVNIKEFEGTGAGLALVEQSQPGDWDVMVIDSIDVPRAVEKGLFEPLPEDKLPFADLFPQVKMDSSTVVDGKRYAITEKFGYNTIAYNKEKVDPEDMQSLASLVDPKRIAREGWFDPQSLRHVWNDGPVRGREAVLWRLLMFQAWMRAGMGTSA